MTQEKLHKRIKLFHLVPSINVGGREKLLLELIKRLDKSIFDTQVCCLKNGGALFPLFEKEKIKIWNFHKKNKVDKKLYFKLAKVFRYENVDIIHTHNPGTLIYGTVGKILSRRSPVIINTEHGYEYSERPLKRLVEAFLCNFIDLNICVSQNLKEQLSNRIYPNRKLKVVYNGIDTTLYRGDLVNSTVNIKEKYGFSNNDLIVGNVARLANVKNHEMLLDAMQIVLKQVPRAKLLIVGDGELRKDLESHAKKYGVFDNITFWGTTNQVAELYHVMDVFALSSLSEGISLTILEAMASGKPVVATDVGGNREIILNKNVGLLVPSNSSKHMAESIISLLKNKNKINEIGANGRARVKEFFNIDLMTKKIEKIYLKFYNSHKDSVFLKFNARRGVKNIYENKY